MVKHARKKQKTGLAANPLGAVRLSAAEADKDEEELQLENLLFGTDPGPSTRHKKDVIIVSEDEEEDEAAEANDIEQLQDSDVGLLAFASSQNVVLTALFAFSFSLLMSLSHLQLVQRQVSDSIMVATMAHRNLTKATRRKGALLTVLRNRSLFRLLPLQPEGRKLHG